MSARPGRGPNTSPSTSTSIVPSSMAPMDTPRISAARPRSLSLAKTTWPPGCAHAATGTGTDWPGRFSPNFTAVDPFGSSPSGGGAMATATTRSAMSTPSSAPAVPTKSLPSSESSGTTSARYASPAYCQVKSRTRSPS